MWGRENDFLKKDLMYTTWTYENVMMKTQVRDPINDENISQILADLLSTLEVTAALSFTSILSKIHLLSMYSFKDPLTNVNKPFWWQHHPL